MTVTKKTNETWKIDRKKITSYLKERTDLKKKEGLGKPDLCEVDQETEDGQVELVVGLEEPSELSMTVGEGDTSLAFVNGKDIFSLRTEELKAELDKRGLN